MRHLQHPTECRTELKHDGRSCTRPDERFTALDAGDHRLWQVLLVVGLVLWCVLLFRGLSNKLRTESRGNLPNLFFFLYQALTTRRELTDALRQRQMFHPAR